MSSNAPGQLLGYTMQYPRALYHLLKANEGDVVCVEILGDVATLEFSGTVVAEEDKSSLSGNPVTDRSVDLWKTFSNWVDFVKSGELLPAQTKFILYRNRKGQSGLVENFSEAASAIAARDAVTGAKMELSDLTIEHIAYKYFKNAALDNDKILEAIVQNFEVITVPGAGFESVINELKRILIPQSQLNSVCHQLSGWLVRLLSERIAAGTPPKITWEEFRSQAAVLFDRARRLELIDFTLNKTINDGEIAHHLSSRPNYLFQLELIELHDDDIFSAVNDFLRARINRDQWIQDEIIDEVVAQDFELRLSKFWKSSQMRIGIIHSALTDEQKGKILLSECQTRIELIRGETPPAATIPGTYHALANEATIGWHPQWPTKMKRVT